MGKDDSASLIDHLKQVKQYKKSGWWESLNEKERKNWSTFMINKFLSMNPDWCSLINEFQHLTMEMPDEAVHDLYVEIIPQDRRFYPYVKKKKSKSEDEPFSWIIEYLQDYYECSEDEAKMYYKIFTKNDQSKEGLSEIMNMYPLTDKQEKELSAL